MKLNRHALRALREAHGLTLTELADRTGLTNAYLSQLESGVRNGSIATHRRLASALRTPLLTIIADPNIDEIDGDEGEAPACPTT